MAARERMQVARRHDPYPWTWEPFALWALMLLMVLLLGIQIGRGLANWFAGAGFTWPLASNVVTSIFEVIGGDPAAGIAHPHQLAHLASTSRLHGSLIGTELLFLIAYGLATFYVLRAWGPWRVLGMASREEAERLLGRTRLWKVAGVVRPDLYGSKQSAARPTGRLWRRRAHARSREQPARPRPVKAVPAERGQRRHATDHERREDPEHREDEDLAVRKIRLNPTDVGWCLGDAHEPRGGELWVPFDRTAGVIGPQGSGKTLDVLTPALLDAPGAALVTLTKPEDLLLSLTERSRDDRPCVVLDPFGLAEGVVDEVVWDPIDGCVSSKIAERRAKAFAAGTVTGAMTEGSGDDAARFYAEESAKVLKCYFHAAALTGRNLDDVLAWVANPTGTTEPEETLSQHPHAAKFWNGLLHRALHGDDRTAGNTITTMQQAMALFFQEETRRRCVPSLDRPVTNLLDVVRRSGTIYLLGREDPYASASPMMTAVAEQVLDTGLLLANQSPYGGRLCPPLLAVLDEMPSTAPLPTLRTRMANERALGLSFIWAAQVRAQLDAIFGEKEAEAVIGLTNVLTIFGGSKDGNFNQQISELLDTVRVHRTSWQSGAMAGRTISGDDIPILTSGEIRRLPEGQALVIAENGKPIIAKLNRCIEGHRGRQLLADQKRLRNQLNESQRLIVTPEAAAEAALVEARRRGLTPDIHVDDHMERTYR
ncbi:type IV secretory pathway TraG/TraD family ATPase VirD4 [Marmoricola sp. URHA0025 HA25]